MENKKDKRFIRRIRHVFAFPFIWLPILPILIADIFLEIFHHICFPLFGLPIVKRSKYIRIDRHKLSYLNISEKAFCIYCGYINGWFHYASTIAADTERYWCGLRHMKSQDFNEPLHHSDFLEYDNESEYKSKYGLN